MFCGAGSYFSNSIEDVALPEDNVLNEVTYPNISESGTNALITFALFLSSIPFTVPLLLFKSPTISPIYSSGVTTSSFIIGSIITAFAAFPDSLNPSFAANSNDNWSESTAWNEPSLRVTFIASTSNPAKGPFFIASLKPFSTEGINSFGILPPLISLMNSRPVLPSSAGPISNIISANLPRPPDCFL